MFHGRSGRLAPHIVGLFLLGLFPSAAQAQGNSNPIIYKIESATQRLEMTVNTSRLLKLDQKIPRAQVNNREILDVTPLSPSEIQVFAKKPGVTQINLWNEAGEIHSVDVVVFGDARELAMLLKSQFPESTINVTPLQNSVVLSGFVDRSEDVSQIIRMAEDYYPKVIPRIEVADVQQILLQVKVMEVSRTKLREMGFDFSTSDGSNFLTSSVSGLIDATASGAGAATNAAGDTIRFGFVDGNNSFYGFLDALQRYELGKVLAEPTLVTVSGRPAFFRAGGEFPILVPQGLGSVSIEYKEYGTRIDFVPIVLGNGRIRLEVRPQVSEIDNTRSIEIGGTVVPGIRTREVDTGVEMRAGQTLALAGLVQDRVEAVKSGLPWVSDLPYFGAPFRRVSETRNEVELLILVTPQLVEALDPHEVPPCGPGMATDSPSDHELYVRGHIEVPSCGPCGMGGCGMEGCASPGGYGVGYDAPGPHIENGEYGSPPAFEEVQPGLMEPSFGDGARTRDSGPPMAIQAPAGHRPSLSRQSSGPRLAQPASVSGSPGQNRQIRASPAVRLPETTKESNSGNPGLIGPAGYDVLN